MRLVGFFVLFVALGMVLRVFGEIDGALLALTKDRYGNETAQEVLHWARVLEQSRGLSDTEKLIRVNDFFNQKIMFVDDVTVWQAKDYWATPFETLSQGRGDCEDYVIAKFVSLLRLGVSAKKLRLIYVQANLGDQQAPILQAHMVLAYYDKPGADPIVLDNLSPQLRFASERRDLFPVFSFDASSLWVQGESQARGDSQSKLSHWKGVLRRIAQDGLSLERLN